MAASKRVPIHFCRECSNILYPKEDKVNLKLMYACRTCQYSEASTSSCIYRNELTNTVGETAGITQDVGSDPTVGSDDDSCMLPLCILCGQEITCKSCGESDSDGGFWVGMMEQEATTCESSSSAEDQSSKSSP